MSQLIDFSAEWRSLAALANPVNYDKITKLSDQLYTHDRKPVFEAMRQMWQDTNAITLHELKYYLRKDVPQELAAPQNVNLDVLIAELQRCAIRRQLDTKAKILAQLAEQDEPDLDQIKQELEFTPVDTTEDSSTITGVANFLTTLNHKSTGVYQFVSTGFPTLDSYLGGEWCKRGLTILGALPGTGKTALAFQSMMLMAQKNNTPSLMINLEMSKERIIQRGVANLANVDGDNLATGMLDDNEKECVEVAAQAITKLPIYIISNSDLDVTRIVGHIKDHAAKGVKVIFVDHLQLIRSSNENRNSALGEIAWALKMAADKYDVRVIVLTQLTDKNGRYVVRDSGDVESKADVFMILTSDSAGDIRRVTVQFMKNRDGKLGEFPFIFHAKYQRFADAAERLNTY